jgi:fucose permease
MKFFGFSGHEIPSSLKYVYVIIFAVIVIGAIAYMMSKLNSTQKNKSSSKKKKSQSPSASPPKSTQKK